MSHAPDVMVLLEGAARRYRRALTTKAIVLGVLSLGLAAGIGWRLFVLRMALFWSVALPGLFVAVAAAGLWAWLRGRWPSQRDLAASLDETLGLEQRLVTAQEFSTAEAPSRLYPLLIEDAARHLSVEQVRLPRAVDPVSGMLIIGLLLVWLWPWYAGMHPGRQDRARPLRPDESPDERREGSARGQTAGARSGLQPSAGSPQQAAGGGASQAGGSQRSGSVHGAERGGEQPGQGRQGGRAQSGSQSAHAGQVTRMDGQQDARQQRAPGTEGDEEAQQQQMAAAHPARAGQRGRPAAGKAAAQQQSIGQQGAAAAALAQAGGGGQRPAGGSSPGSLGNQEALKAEIQGLLKDLSGELKQLEAQLEASKQVPPQAGTGTDPQLFGSGAGEELPTPHGASTPVAIQLRTDVAETKSSRPGRGTAPPSGRVAEAPPSAQAESARLSDVPREELPVVRPAVPPVYRGLFDRLRTEAASPDEEMPL